LQKRVGPDARFRLWVLGDGPERERYTELAEQLGVNCRVHFAKYVFPDQVWQYYAQAHVFVLPTMQDNWPLVVPEAMSMGLPVLLSNYAGSVPDLIRTGENGFAFDPEDHDVLAALMEYYVRNPHAVRRHGQRSLELVSLYNPERVASVILSAIDMAKSATNERDR
jgi:glycosyltransferase involved in cell wall biosynthesis